MSSESPVVYDPDPTQLEVDAFSEIGLEGMSLEELCSPPVVKMLIHMRRSALTQLKFSQQEVTALRKTQTTLQNDRENLRVETAILKSQVNNTVIEIPASVLIGFAINLLTNNSKNAFAWVMLVAGVLVLIYIRIIPRFLSQSTGTNKQESTDA